jgi:DNA mismatch endonuclease, patch repair protein
VPDHLTPEERSAHMRRIQKRDTSPEMAVRRIAHSLGYRFRLHRRDLPGTPDLVFLRLRKAILVHGCFWHQHEGCRLARKPKSRLEYWLPKLERNQRRDALAEEALKRLGWSELIIWECETTDGERLRRRIDAFLSKNLGIL